MSNDAILWEAARCLQRNWVPVPVALHGKEPALGPAWENVRPTFDTLTSYFTDRSLGVLLGTPSGHLVDIDLDCPEAEALSDLLPKTECRFGRDGHETHLLFYCPIEKTTRFQTKEMGTIIEIRSTGGQSVLPPSLWVDKDTGRSAPRVWTGNGPPATVDPKLLFRAVEIVAGTALLARAFKAEGIRHDAAMALAGGLARSGWSDEAVRKYVLRVCEAAGHSDMSDRLHGINTTLEAVKNKQSATGWPKLIDLIGKAVVSKASKWLRLEGDVGTGVGLGDVSQWSIVQEGEDPPVWRVKLSPTAERFVRVPTDVLISPDRMKLAIGNQIGVIVQLPKKKLYDQYIAEACDKKDFEERSEDAEATIALMESIERWLSTKAHGEEWSKLDEDQNLFIENEGKKYEVTRLDLINHMLREKGYKIAHGAPRGAAAHGFRRRACEQRQAFALLDPRGEAVNPVAIAYAVRFSRASTWADRLRGFVS